MFRLTGLGLVAMGVGRAGATDEAPGEEVVTPVPEGFSWKETVLDIGPGKTFAEGGELIAINGATPGPEIRLRRGDFFYATVNNRWKAPITVHWHGMVVPNLMDGVPDVTQLALPPGRSQTYAYPVVQSGTYWYHSHEGLEEQQGLAGPLIIEDPDEPHVYDRDVVLFFEDRLTVDPREVLAALQGRDAPAAAVAATKAPEGRKVFVGQGSMASRNDVFYDRFPVNGREAEAPFVVDAKPGERLRLRFINGSSSTYFRMIVDGHRLEVIEKDGNRVLPCEAEAISMAVAERYDALLTVGEPGVYRIVGQAEGQATGALAVLRVGDAELPEKFAAPEPAGDPPKSLTVMDLEAAEVTTLPDGPERDIVFELVGDMKNYRWSINGEYYPDAAPVPIAAGERVNLEFRNKTMMDHPMHLHGHFFRLIHPNLKTLDRAPLMDTVNVPMGQSVEVQFFADNPGAWVCHCHNLYHMATGMLRVLRYSV